MNAVSLRDRIQSAKSIDALDALLLEGKGYTDALPESRKRWEAVAAARRDALSSKQDSQVGDVDSSEPAKKVRKTRAKKVVT